jgi:hypothetical protein
MPRRLTWVMTFVALATLAGLVLAQETTAKRMRRFAVRPGDVDLLGEVLSLTPEQAASVRSLRDGAAASFDVVARKFIEREAAVAAAERGSEDRRRKSDLRFEAMCELWNLRWPGSGRSGAMSGRY